MTMLSVLLATVVVYQQTSVLVSSECGELSRIMKQTRSEKQRSICHSAKH